MYGIPDLQNRYIICTYFVSLAKLKTYEIRSLTLTTKVWRVVANNNLLNHFYLSRKPLVEVMPSIVDFP